MRIGIDARFVGPQGTGLGKYTEKLILNLTKIDSQNQYRIFLKKDNWDFLKLPKNFQKVQADIPWYSIAEQLKMPGIFRNENLDVLHVPHFNVPIFYRRKFIVTIHDLIHHDFKNDTATTHNPVMFKLKRLAYKKVIENAIYKSAKIITPSNFVKDEIAGKFSIDPTKIVVTYEAAEEEYFDKNSKFFFGTKTSQIQNSKLTEKNPFLLYVGNAYPHKNLEKLLEAFKILLSERNAEHTIYKIRDLNLVIVCSRDVFWQRLTEEIREKGLQNRVVTTGYLNSSDLRIIFKEADAYIFPSLAEGFGIPGLNAMASGLPVIASGIPTLKEIYGDAALYFDPQDAGDIAAKIVKLTGSPKLKADLVKKGKAQVKKYSWQKMASQTLKVYSSIV
ncbi:MAG: glycosyltransferase family 1 protein [Candidatus Curtissbacteria bacterium]|nr:glycosyltransferase family 1 protein [Candidatus Curtissbacteria bacterium]